LPIPRVAVPTQNIVEDIMPIIDPILEEIGVPIQDITEITEEIVTVIEEVVQEEEVVVEEEEEEVVEEEEEEVEEERQRRGGGGSSTSEPVEEVVLLDYQNLLNEIVESGEFSRCKEFDILPYEEACEIYVLANNAVSSSDIQVCEPTDSQFVYDNCVNIVKNL